MGVISIVFPTYNESKNLPLLLPAVAKAMAGKDYEVIIVDDNSPDETWKVAREIGEQDPHVRVLRRVGRRGLSSAVIEGFLAARGQTLVVADADGQHDLSLVPRLAEAAEQNGGMAIGSRYTEGGSVGQWDERRHALSRLATRMALRLCKVQATDPMSGFFALRRSVFEEALPRLNPKGFKILLDLLVHVPSTTPVAELPFTFGLRTHGESKLSRRVQIEFLEYLYDVTAGRFVPLTFVQYGIVGTMGVVVNLAVYYLAEAAFPPIAEPRVLGLTLPFLAGVEAAILFNFLLNNALTFSHVRLRGMRAVLGFVGFTVLCLLGAIANYAVASYLYRQGASQVLAISIGAFLGMLWNYTMGLQFIWKEAR
jgi:dolichol-phosphate mannosyltransferase